MVLSYNMGPWYLIFLCCLLQPTVSYYFENGYDHYYTYSSRSDLFGLHHFTTIMKFRVRPLNQSSGSINALFLDSFVQYSEDGYVVKNPQQWDLSKRFSFRLRTDGTVDMVHFDREDEEEVIALKKVLTSTLSAKANIPMDHPRVFKNKEMDHSGELEHEYRMSRGIDGLQLHRTHNSTETVHRWHNKTMQYNKAGTVKFVMAEDTIKLRNSDKSTYRTNVANATAVPEWSSGDFPRISSSSYSKLRFTQKRQHGEETADDDHISYEQLHTDTILISSKTSKTTFKDISERMERTLQCIRANVKDAVNKTECVHELHKMVLTLKDDDYQTLASRVLGVKCDVNDTECADERNLFLDFIGGKSDSFSQRLLTKYLIQSINDSNEMEAFRILSHFIHVKEPVNELMVAVERICFGENDESHGSEQLSKTQRRACLTLGALSNVIKETNPEKAELIVAKMETWLQFHNESRSAPILQQRRKRSLTDFDHIRMNHIVTKLVFINALGNSAMNRSLGHILSYLKPNQGSSVWRRAAVLTLRHFSCNTSANALLNAALYDEHDIVKEMALKSFSSHPEGRTLSQEQKDMILSRKYTYPILMRLKRGLNDIDFNKGLRLSITLPGISWEKTIGTRDIGAGFGIVIRNQMELELKPLQRHFMIDVYDTAYVEAYCGLLNIHADIFKALICYKGHIGYDFNNLKDFGINTIQDLVQIFDRIMKSTVEPIKWVVENFKNIVQTFGGGGVQKLFNNLVQAVKNLPLVLKTASDKFVALTLKVADFGGLPWLDDIKRLMVRVKTFITDVRDDLMGFYNTIVDLVTVTLPYIGKLFMDSIATIVSSIKNLLSNPTQSMSGMGQALKQIKLAVGMFLDVKNRILDACFFLKGKTPYWMTIGEEVKVILTEVQELVTKVSQPGPEGIIGSTIDHVSSRLSDGIQYMEEQSDQIKAELLHDLRDALGPLNSLFEADKTVFDTFQSIMDVVQGVKSSFKILRDTIVKTKSSIQKTFGPKFNLKFPTRRRDESESCSTGIWPTTSGGIYSTIGVDVLLGKYSDVACPLDGMVFKRSSTQVLIKPNDADFLQYEIVIDNINPDRFVSTEGSFFEAGKTIGKAGVSLCQPNFIHVAMRYRREQFFDDEEYDYVDPSPYLDRLVPYPQWIEECNEMTLIIMNRVIDVSPLDEEGADEKKTELKRDLGDEEKCFNEMDPSKEPSYILDGIHSNSSQNVANGFLDGIKKSLSSFSNLGNLFSDEGFKIPNILDVVDLNKFAVSKIIGILNVDLAKDFKEMILKLASAMTKAPLLPPGSLSITQLRNIIGNIADDIGDKYSIISEIFSLAESRCPTFQNGLRKGLGHICQPHAECLGLTCVLIIPYGSIKKMQSLDILVNACTGQIRIILPTTTIDITLDGLNHNISLGQIGGLSAELIINGDVVDNDVILSVEVEVCHDEYFICLRRIKVTTDIKFPQIATCDGFGDLRSLDKVNEIENMTFGDLILMISENDIMELGDMQLIGKIRDAVVAELFKNPKNLLRIVEEEFPNKLDYCADVDIPIPPFHMTFFDVGYLFFVGPIPLQLDFGAGGSVTLDVNLGICFLSMEAKVTATPGAVGKVWGSATVNLGFARGGIKLIGYILATEFPVTSSFGFSKCPLDVTAKMDLRLIPIKLELRAFVQILFIFKYITIFDASIWSYTAPTIKRNIFTTSMISIDESPPEFLPNYINASTRREGQRRCILKQIKYRHHLDAAFRLEVSTFDDLSQVDLSYTIGTQRGGTNVVDWTEMGGASLLVPTNDLPSGVPLYWTIRARNCQGLEAYSYCMLQTYDTSVPDGRIDPSYQYSSHPSKISGTIVVFDDSQLMQTHEKALGFSSGQYGIEFVPWNRLIIDKTSTRDGIDDELKHFSVPKTGRLTASSFARAKTRTAVECAKLCLEYTLKCVSFDYEYHSENCDLHEVVEGPRASLRRSGTYKSYERLVVGHSSYILYDNLTLSHATVYYINAKITNTLGYVAYITSQGTIVDFTPPVPGPLGPLAKDTLEARGCSAAVTQRCVEVTWKENHMIVVDDEESRTVFNGHKPLQDQRYTINNHIASVNFHGFHDDESGIWGYTWMAGEFPCSQNIVNENDPHIHHASEKYWTHNGYVKNIHLTDGLYYVTVRALNNIVFGGALVTTVCHNVPFTVDTTPPTFIKVLDIFYDEDFDILAVYFNATDSLSHLARVDFGLGRTKHDVSIRGYELQKYVPRNEQFIAVYHLGLGHGVPAWIRLRAVNNVGLHTARHSDEQILIDLTPPIAGSVLDGNILDTDMDYQADNTTICAEWIGFYDEESGIRDYIWGVGTEPGTDNVVQFHNLTHHFKRSCVGELQMQHNTTYFSTVMAFNGALNSKMNSSTSDGVLIDITPPLPGAVWDGKLLEEDISYSSETARKYCNWKNFSDLESHIVKYDIMFYINRELIKVFEINNKTEFSDRSITMEHRDTVQFVVTAENGAGLTVDVASDGFLIDHTTPVMEYIHDTASGKRYQSFNNHLDVSWLFLDEDSGIKEYRYFVNEEHQGSQHTKWPETKDFEKIIVSPDDSSLKMTIDQLDLSNGAKYTLVVTAINNALLSTSRESSGVIVDTTPPVITKVHIGQPMEDEELDYSNEKILHADPHTLTVTWMGQDPESEVDAIYLGIGTSSGNMSITRGFVQYQGSQQTIIVGDLGLETFSVSQTLYYVSIKAINGAGLESTIVSSKPILVLRANIPGQIFDGRAEFVDQDITVDKTSIAMTFAGFESEACDIQKYEWAIGTDAHKSDILPYSGYGLSVHNSSHGQAQIHIELIEDETVYVTVRAQPGYNCHEEYIVSCSDGIKVDTIPPDINYVGPDMNDKLYVHHNKVYYQPFIDSFDLLWNISDASDLQEVSVSVGSLPFLTDIVLAQWFDTFETPRRFLSPDPGHSTFLNLDVKDEAGNDQRTYADPVVADITPPRLRNIDCTDYISIMKSVVTCSWEYVEEFESVIKSLTISVESSLERQSSIVHDITHGKRYFDVDALILLSESVDMDISQELFVSLTISNVFFQNTTYTRQVKIDISPPSSAVVKVVTKTSPDDNDGHLQCQSPQTYVDVLVENQSDEDTGIEKTEVAIGTFPGHSDIHGYLDVPNSGSIFFGNLNLEHGQIFYATAKITNRAGLSKLFFSDSVTVSVRPILSVIDGPLNTDKDFQNNINIVQGSWDFSDTCSIETVMWKIEDLIGNVVQDFEIVHGGAKTFYNDEYTLQDGHTYINVIKIRDYLNRTFEKSSDGITVQILRPSPGKVRDGLAEDINYQQEVHELSANWDNFGDISSEDPTQTIAYYEVAVGDDNRFPQTRSNVHYFVNAGLNRSHTFRNLNLTLRDVTYYITVRGVSLTGSHEDSISNGVNVGFTDAIVPGTIETPAVQSDTSKVVVSWTDFQSDFGIKQYLVGIYNDEFLLNSFSVGANESIPCDNLSSSLNILDVYPSLNVGLDTIIELENLELKHNNVYLVIVTAVNEANMCRSVSSSPILVDTTPVNLTGAQLYIGHVKDDGGNDIFISDPEKLEIAWQNVEETESDIDYIEMSLYKTVNCSSKVTTNELRVDSISARNENKITFYQLTLLPHTFYFVHSLFVNAAGLNSSMKSSAFRLDESPPLPGVVKISDDWTSESTFQASTSKMTSWIALARSEDEYFCPNHVSLFPPDREIHVSWIKMDGIFSQEFVEYKSSSITLLIGYNTAQTRFLKSGIESTTFQLLSGNYTIRLKSAVGKNIISIASFASRADIFPKDYTPPYRTGIADVVFNSSRSETADTVSENSTTAYAVSENSTTAYVSTHYSTNINSTPSITDSSKQTSVSNMTPIYNELPDPDGYGFGLSILGEKQNGSEHWDAMFWVADRYKKTHEWITLKDDPALTVGTFMFSVESVVSHGEYRYNIKLLINGIVKATASGIVFGRSIKAIVTNFNRFDYEEPIVDIFEPFLSKIIVTEIKVPRDKEKMCLYGSGFFDQESGIEELWVGITSEENSNGSVVPMQLYHSWCLPCEQSCIDKCKDTCTESSFNDFELVTIELNHLNLLPTIAFVSNASENTIEVQETHTYYVTVEAINFAGQSCISRSNGIMVDTTSPLCEYVRCLDPTNSMEEPTEYIGTNNTVAAYWSCSDLESEVYSYSVGIGMNSNGTELLNMTDVGLQTQKQIYLENGLFFTHGSEYYFHLWAYNAARSAGKFFCKFKAELYPPDVSNVSTHSMFEYMHVGEIVQLTTFPDRAGVFWNSTENIAEVYKWGIGTEEGKFDILPMIRAGVSEVGNAAILQGHVWFNGTDMNTTVSRYHDNANTTYDGSLFLLEPGRCLHHRLLAVGRSHLSSPVPVLPTCITRPNDLRILVNESKTTRFVLYTNGSVKADAKKDFAEHDVKLFIDMTAAQSGFTIGTLNNSDVSKHYGTDATSDFSPAITDPETTKSFTSRFLRNRLKSFQRLSFFISPLPYIDTTDLFIDISVNISDISHEDDTILALLFWNSNRGGTGEWIHVQEDCDQDSIGAKENEATYRTQVCHQTLLMKETENPSREKRDAEDKSTILSSPLQFGLFKILSSCVNTEPSIITNNITTIEDTPIVMYQLVWYDAENDSITFYNPIQPVYGQSEITMDGRLTYIPPTDFSGQVYVYIEVIESSVCHSVSTVNKTISITVLGENDSPVIGFLSNDNTNFTLADHLNANIVVFLNGNNTEHAIGSVHIADADEEDSLSITHRSMISSSANFVIQESAEQAAPTNTITPLKSKTYQRIDLVLKTNLEFIGHLHYQLLGSDRQGQMTARLDLHLYVLISPCNYGSCIPNGMSRALCNDSIRAFSFDSYSCSCVAGYQGVWCDNEINECLDNPCSTLYDCIDHVAYFTCQINPGYLTAVLLSTLAVVVVICCLVYRLKKAKQHDRISDSSTRHKYSAEPHNYFNSSLSLRSDDKIPVEQQPSTEQTFKCKTFQFPQESSPPSATDDKIPVEQQPSTEQNFKCKTFQFPQESSPPSATNLELDSMLKPGMACNPIYSNKAESKKNRYQSMFTEQNSTAETTESSDRSLVEVYI